MLSNRANVVKEAQLSRMLSRTIVPHASCRTKLRESYRRSFRIRRETSNKSSVGHAAIARAMVLRAFRTGGASAPQASHEESCRWRANISSFRVLGNMLSIIEYISSGFCECALAFAWIIDEGAAPNRGQGKLPFRPISSCSCWVRTQRPVPILGLHQTMLLTNWKPQVFISSTASGNRGPVVQRKSTASSALFAATGSAFNFVKRHLRILQAARFRRAWLCHGGSAYITENLPLTVARSVAPFSLRAFVIACARRRTFILGSASARFRIAARSLAGNFRSAFASIIFKAPLRTRLATSGSAARIFFACCIYRPDTRKRLPTWSRACPAFFGSGNFPYPGAAVLSLLPRIWAASLRPAWRAGMALNACVLGSAIVQTLAGPCP